MGGRVGGGVEGAERVMMMLRRFFNGRNLGGMESQVLRPMMTALKVFSGCYQSSSSVSVNASAGQVSYRRWHARGDPGEVLHLFAQAGPGHGAVEADAHVARGGDDEG